MRSYSILCLPILAVAACASLQRSPPVQAGSFECTATDSQSAGRYRIVVAEPDPSGGLRLRLETGRQVVLAPASGASGGFYASPAYAWRSTAEGPVLTDVEAIQTFNCRPAQRMAGRTAR